MMSLKILLVKCDQTISDLESSGTILDDGGNDVAALVFEFDTQYEINRTDHFATSYSEVK